MEEKILSVGIDVGTSTTQLIFSEITVKNVAGFGKVPQTEITDKKIIYRSRIYFTPLLSQDVIDGEKVKEIIEKEYELAGIKKEELTTGAVIITGESSRKKNAKQVVKSISELAGDFVVAAAGPDLESILAGKGAGAALLSKNTGKLTANLDIGGGTTNICCFKEGEVYDTACLDIGGRLVKVEKDRITYIAEKTQYLIKRQHLGLKVGDSVLEAKTMAALVKLTDVMADLLAQAVGLSRKGGALEHIKTNRLLTSEKVPELITFSGGVALCMMRSDEPFAYGDIGVLLARAVMKNKAFKKAAVEKSIETMGATVIGAGNESMNISGSTIEYTEKDFPQKNIPIGKIRLEQHEDIEKIEENIQRAADHTGASEEDIQFAVAMKGIRCPSFAEIQQMAGHIIRAYEKLFSGKMKLIIVTEADIGKALGQALRHIDHQQRTIICIDSISCCDGDYIDLGMPIASGSVIPVVVKTLVFEG